MASERSKAVFALQLFETFRCGLWVLLAGGLPVFGMVGCDRTAGDTPDATMPNEAVATAERTKANPETQTMLAGSLQHSELGEIQARMAKVLPVTHLASADQPKAAITWNAPSCPLRYRFRADLEIVALDGLPPASGVGIRMAGEVTMQRGADGLTVVRNGELELSQVYNGIKRPGGTQPAGSLAEVRLRRDGAQWSEVDGPTALWSAYGSFPGLVVFWPALPAATSPGSTVPWALTIHERGDGMRIETTRGSTKAPEGMPVPDPSPTTLNAEVELEGWLSVQGQAAAVLVSRVGYDSALDHSKSKETPGEVDEELEAASPDFDVHAVLQETTRFVVLDSGRLLWAEVGRTTHVTMKLGKGEAIKQRHDTHATIELVDACDGPVFVTPLPEPTVEEATLLAISEFRRAVVEDNEEQIVRLLAPEIISAHGKKATMRLLREHVARHGAGALGAVELADDVRREGDRIRVHMSGSTDPPDGIGWTVHIVVQVELREGRPIIVRMGTDTLERDDGWSILELSADRLTSGYPRK